MLLISIGLQAQNDPLWMRYPAISPDGSEIAFSYKGDLYKVSTTGGTALQLTNHQAHDTQPVWSNDGQHIAFASDRYGNFDVFITSSNGGASKRLTEHSYNDFPSDFTPDNSKVIYASSRMDDHKAVFFPSGALSELYAVNVNGGREKQLLSVPAEAAMYSPDGSKLLFHNRKGYENAWRKHHTSSVTRDIYSYNFTSNEFTKIISWDGEDRNPVWKNESEFYYLTEKSGDFNIWKSDLSGAEPTQLTQFKDHPVRFLSGANNGVLCFGWDGEIYTLKEGESPQKVSIKVNADSQYNAVTIKKITGGATDFAVSPNGKEVAFIAHGEVFVTSIEHRVTKRITNTPEQERNLTFNKDGKALVYAAERNNDWSIYQSTLGRKDDRYFYNATTINEVALVNTEADEFQPVFSPDGKEIAYLEERTTLKVYNLASKQTRTVMDGSLNYSYSDGDQYFAWSPDSKWLLTHFFDADRWNTDIGLLNVTTKELINLTKSGYRNYGAKFAMDGEMVYWATDKQGYRSHGSWGAQSDVYAIFLTQDAYNKFSLSKSDYELWKEEQEGNKEEKSNDEADKKKSKKKKGESDDKDAKTKQLKIEKEGLEDRKVRLTTNSSFLSDFLIDKKGEELFYITRFEKGYDLWSNKFKDKQTKLLAKLGSTGSRLEFDSKQKEIYYLNRGRINKVATKDGANKGVSFSSEMNLNKQEERVYMFNHAWRQFKKKFYVENLHGVDWDMYRDHYLKFLPHINNGYDFAEMLSEILGEVNASHTGSGYFGRPNIRDETATFAAFYDEDYAGDGLKIIEILDKSPLYTKTGKIKSGVVIEKINDVVIKPEDNQYTLLNRAAGNKLLVGFYNPESKQRWSEVIKPITLRAQNQLLYERWIESREAKVESLSNGQIGYVHVRGMNSASFREVYEKVLGKHNKKKALIVDTRFNGGGWLHDDLATFLNGKTYLQFEPRGQKNMGGEPLSKWQKPSCVLMSESNYSDAHMFPYTYKVLGIGKLVGMPVPGTGTAVWWETLIDGETYFGIPQVGMRTNDGKLMENNQLDPDIKVNNEYDAVLRGEDQQLQAAVKHLLEITK